MTADKRKKKSQKRNHRRNGIWIPRSVLASAKDLADIDDWVQAHDAEFIAEIRRIRDGESSRGMTLDEFAKQRKR